MIIFRPWRKFGAVKNRGEIRKFLNFAADETRITLRRGMTNGPHSGRMYGRHQASAPGEYPARDTGRLVRSIRKRVTSTEATVGTNMYYAKFLASGTRKMGERKMSEEALKEALPRIRAFKFRWVEWRRG